MRERGFALLVVLWSLVLLTLIVTHLTMTARTEARIAANLDNNAAAEAAADGAVHEAIFRLLDSADDRWQADGSLHMVRFDGAETSLRIRSEDGKINPNIASQNLMRALLEASGAEPAQADSLAAAILDWREPGNMPRPGGAKLEEYRSADLDYGPPGAPFETLDELKRVLGMTPAIFERLKPHLSLYQSATPDLGSADPVVARIIQDLAIPRRRVVAIAPKLVSVTAETTTDRGGHFLRHATVRIDPVSPRGYSVLAWDTAGD